MTTAKYEIVEEKANKHIDELESNGWVLLQLADTDAETIQALMQDENGGLVSFEFDENSYEQDGIKKQYKEGK
jgi:hypothetical protein